MIKAAIFDMDGLLIDSEPLWNEAMLTIYPKIGVPMTPAMTQETTGLQTKEDVEYWYRRYPWKTPSQKSVAQQLDQHVLKLIQERGIAKPGAHAIIQLCESLGLPIAIASSSTVPIINVVLKKLDIKHRIKIIHSADFEHYGKPHPAIYLGAAKKLSVHPEDCLAFEDSANGVLAAKSAKMHCIAVPSAELRTDKRYGIADIVVGSLSEITIQMIQSL